MTSTRFSSSSQWICPPCSPVVATCCIPDFFDIQLHADSLELESDLILHELPLHRSESQTIATQYFDISDAGALEVYDLLKALKAQVLLSFRA